VKALYTNAKAKSEDIGESSLFPLKNSVLQGETLRPKLFSLFIEDIVEILNKSVVTSIKIGKGDINI
jgi:hypothetical protein